MSYKNWTPHDTANNANGGNNGDDIAKWINEASTPDLIAFGGKLDIGKAIWKDRLDAARQARIATDAASLMHTLIEHTHALTKQTDALVNESKTLNAQTDILVNESKTLNNQTTLLVAESKNLTEQNRILVTESVNLSKLTRILIWLTAALGLFAVIQIVLMVFDIWKHK